MIELNHDQPGNRWLHCEGSPELLFTENETNARRLFGVENRTPYVKDGINDYVVHGAEDAVNPEHTGTKAAAHYQLTVGAGRDRRRPPAPGQLRLQRQERLRRLRQDVRAPPARSRRVLRHRHSAGPLAGRAERHAPGLRRHAVVQAVLSLRRQRLAGGRSRQSAAAAGARATAAITSGRTSTTPTSSRCPTSGSIPWYAAWDLAFHCIPLALVDSDFAKEQLIADAARVVHAPERTDSRLRVGVRRRQSSGARLGRVARLQDRQEAQRQRRSRIPASASSTS